MGTSPPKVVEEEARFRALNDEAALHQRDARRPGRAGAAAAERARLTRELAGLVKALALTTRVLDDEAEAPSATKMCPAGLSRFRSPDRIGGGPAAGDALSSRPARVVRISA